MTVEQYQAAILERLDAVFVLAVAFASVTVLLLAFMAVSGMGRR